MAIYIGCQCINQAIAIENEVTRSEQLQIVCSDRSCTGSRHALACHIQRQGTTLIAIGLLFDSQWCINGNR